MLNINQLTTQLRMLPDQALQRVAVMYKQDPYILPLVVSEGMARKKMRAASQAQMAQPQPKVADQAVASLGYTPEEVGIASLPAQNMQGMADGGIAGYADGGDMSLAQSVEPVVRMAEGGIAGYSGRDESLVRLNNPNDILSPFYSQALPQSGETAAERKARRERERELEAAAEAEQRPFARLLKSLVPESKLRKTMYPSQEELKSRQQGREVSAVEAAYRDPRRAALDVPNAPTGAPAPAPAPASAAPASAAPASATASASGTAPTRAAAPSEGGIYALTGRMFDPVAQELRSARGRAMLEAQRRGDEELAAFEAGKPKGKAYEGLEGMLRKEAEGEAGERKQAAAMAIFNAGLAMMSGTSPRALENIGKGAMVGSAQYSDALKDMKKAAKERQKMLADIENARRAEERDDNKTALTLMQRANDRQERAEMFFTEGSMKLGMTKGEVGARLYGTQMETESRERTARASDPLALFRALSVPGPIREGYEFAQRAKSEPVDERTYKKEWASSPVLQMNYPNVDDYVKMMMSTRPQGTAPNAASQSADQALVDTWLKPPR